MVDHRWHFSAPDFLRFAGYLNSHGYKMPAGREALWLSHHVTAGRPFPDADKRHLHYLRLDNSLRTQWAAEYIDSVVRAEGAKGLVPGTQVVDAVRQAKAEYDQTPEAQRNRQAAPLGRYQPPPIASRTLPLPGEGEGSVAAEAKTNGKQGAKRTEDTRSPGQAVRTQPSERQ